VRRPPDNAQDRSDVLSLEYSHRTPCGYRPRPGRTASGFSRDGIAHPGNWRARAGRFPLGCLGRLSARMAQSGCRNIPALASMSMKRLCKNIACLLLITGAVTRFRKGTCFLDQLFAARKQRTLAALTARYSRTALAGGGCGGFNRREDSSPAVGYNKSCKCNRSTCEHAEQNSIVTCLGLFHASSRPCRKGPQVPSRGGGGR
jgi:hypothetical protein